MILCWALAIDETWLSGSVVSAIPFNIFPQLIIGFIHKNLSLFLQQILEKGKLGYHYLFTFLLSLPSLKLGLSAVSSTVSLTVLVDGATAEIFIFSRVVAVATATWTPVS